MIVMCVPYPSLLRSRGALGGGWVRWGMRQRWAWWTSSGTISKPRQSAQSYHRTSWPPGHQEPATEWHSFTTILFDCLATQNLQRNGTVLPPYFLTAWPPRTCNGMAVLLPYLFGTWPPSNSECTKEWIIFTINVEWKTTGNLTLAQCWLGRSRTVPLLGTSSWKYWIEIL